MVDSYGSYWFQGMDAQAEILLVQSLASKGFENKQTNDDDLDAKQYKAWSLRFGIEHQVVFLVSITLQA